MSSKRSGKRRSTASGRDGPARKGASPVRRPIPRPVIAMLALALAGVLLTAYLTAVNLSGAAALACGVGSGCDVIQTSRWSVLLGVPIAAWGLVTYLVIAILVWRSRRRVRSWAKAWVVVLVGFAISVYLTVVSVVELGATCAYCLASLGLLAALLAGLSWLRPGASGEPRLRDWAPGAAIAAAAIVGGLHANYAGIFDPAAGPEKPQLRALAEHLSATGAHFYGAYWCPHCNEQKALFEASADRLPYVECTPDGRNAPRALACVAKNVNAYPTWIINGRRVEQVVQPAELARMSGFDWQAGTH